MEIIQTIRTQWSKLSRGAPMAVRRNATPDVLDLPTAIRPEPDGQTAWHDARFIEPDFVKSEELRWSDLSAIRVPGLDLVRQPNDRIRIDVFGKSQFTLQPGEIGAVVYNWVDDAMEDGWRSSVYHKVSAHIANGLPWSTRMFHAAPSHSSSVLRSLG